LFDVAADVAEARDQAPTHSDEVARLTAELETWRDALALPPLDAPVGTSAVPDVDPAARERLRALGYVE
jgi:hypothetical protein